MIEKAVIDAALQEVTNPKWGMTQQFFELHELRKENPIALVQSKKDDPEQKSTWRVYLNLEDVSYYFQISIQEEDNKLSVAGCNSSEHAYVSLHIFSRVLSPDKIEQKLLLPATQKRYLGEPKFENHSSRVRDEHFYAFESQAPKAWNFDNRLKKLLEDLLPKRQQLEEVHRSSISCMISAAYYAWQSQMWGIHLDINTISMLNRLGIATDISLYAEGLELRE